IILCSLGDDLDPDMRRRLLGIGVLWANDPDQAAQQCEWLYKTRRAQATGALLARAAAAPSGRAAAPSGRAASVAPKTGAAGVAVSQFATQCDWLSQNGMAVPEYRIVKSAEEARAAAAVLGWPLVAKPVPEVAEHKTEQGLVHLRLKGDADLMH